MKKIVALILAVLMCLFLCACGGKESTNVMTKEEMLNVAIDADVNEMLTTDNPLKAKQTFCGKVLKITDTVDSIEEDRFIIDRRLLRIAVYLPEEDLVNLNPKQEITIVGLTNDDFVTETEFWDGNSSEITYYVMEQAYFVTDRYEYTGIPESKNSSFPEAWNVKFPNDSFQKLVYFEDSVDVNKYENKEITFSAKSVGGKYYDAVITGTPTEEPAENR